MDMHVYVLFSPFRLTSLLLANSGMFNILHESAYSLVNIGNVLLLQHLLVNTLDAPLRTRLLQLILPINVSLLQFMLLTLTKFILKELQRMPRLIFFFLMLGHFICINVWLVCWCIYLKTGLHNRLQDVYFYLIPVDTRLQNQINLIQ